MEHAMVVSTTNADAIKNVRDGKTLSGLNFSVVPHEGGTYLEHYTFVFWEYFFETYGADGLEAALGKALDSVRDIPGAHHFKSNPAEQIDELAAFGLVQIDRWVRAASRRVSGWSVVWLYDQITELSGYVERHLWPGEEDPQALAKAIVSKSNRRAALLKHDRDPKRAARNFVFECWQDWHMNPNLYKNATEFARDMLDKHPDVLVSEVVVTRWVRGWRRQLN